MNSGFNSAAGLLKNGENQDAFSRTNNGLFFDFGGRVDIRHSVFSNNGDDGVDIEELNKVYIKNSYFNDNYNIGVNMQNVINRDPSSIPKPSTIWRTVWTSRMPILSPSNSVIFL